MNLYLWSAREDKIGNYNSGGVTLHMSNENYVVFTRILTFINFL